MNIDKENRPSKYLPASSAGVTMVELLVALSIGSFLIIGAVQVANQSRQAFRINESIAKVQETAQFAMDTVEADLRMASNWGLLSRTDAVVGQSTTSDADPLGLLPATGSIIECGTDWALDLARPIEGSDNSYTMPATCPAQGTGGAQDQSDVVTVRRATVGVALPDNGRLQVQTTRVQGQLFKDGARPAGYDAVTSETHNLLVNTYYVAKSSELIPGVPTLRRKTLTVDSGAPAIEDQEVAPGVENMQLQLGVDVDRDNTVDRYVNPGSAILDPGNIAFIPAARVMTARIWLLVRSIDRENGIVQPAAGYSLGNAPLFVPNDDFRRLLVSKTILLRNART